MNHIVRPDANAVFDVLVSECGADCRQRAEFVALWPECVEFRFQGALGFGGKVWWNADRCYVTIYREDETARRREMVERANERLATEGRASP